MALLLKTTPSGPRKVPCCVTFAVSARVMNMHYVRNTGVCCRRLIPCKSWWDSKFLWILRTFFSCKPVFWEWEWCLKCVLKRWPDPGTASSGWMSLRLALLQQKAFSEDWKPARVREVLGFCAVPGNCWEAVITLSKPTPCTDQSTSPTRCCQEGGCLACHSWGTFGVMHGCGRAQWLAASALRVAEYVSIAKRDPGPNLS